MQRLVIALILIAILVALGFALMTAARRTFSDVASSDQMGTPMQRISFFLLAALMIYVAFAGAS